MFQQRTATMKLDNISFRMLKEEDYEVVLQFLANIVSLDEPIVSTLLFTLEETRAVLGPYIKKGLRQGVSIGAFDDITNKLCGARINFLCKNLNSPDESESSNSMNDNSLKIRQLDKILTNQFEDVVAEILSGKDYLELFLVGVGKEYGQRGIATEFYRRSRDIAEQHDCSMLAVLCTSAYTLRATTRLGYNPIKQVVYKDYVDPITGEKILKNMRKPHVTLTLLTKVVK